MVKNLSWKTYILCFFGVGYLIEECRNEMLEYVEYKAKCDLEKLKNII